MREQIAKAVVAIQVIAAPKAQDDNAWNEVDSLATALEYDLQKMWNINEAQWEELLNAS